ncbi:PcfJ domain-containing protein [Oceanobacillus sp. CFH 90083]|uniref:PcfJ domain-containing protein n=1 Tax=Oceanobacillus sp. CFH 90083 TaxID=2592336 RepID=UPI00128B9D06|nr:PcfJ domain-containing protein [Oceanobacillus sp. CFH 90083]
MEFKDHFSKTVSQELIDYVKNVVFEEDRYLFVRREKKVQYGFCSHCRQEYTTNYPHVKGALKHNQQTVCSHCQSLVTVKSAGRGRKNLYNEAYVVWYEKSQINPAAIVAVGLLVGIHFDNYKGELVFGTVTSYLFEPGYSEQRFYASWRDKWTKLKNIRSEIPGTMRYKKLYVSYDKIRDVVKGTPFQYSTWEQYKDIFDREDLVHFFDLAARYGCIEYLTKIGFHSCVKAKIQGDRTYGAINWNGKTLEKVTRLSKADLKQLQKEGIAPEPATLHSYHKFKKAGHPISFAQASWFGIFNFVGKAAELGEPLGPLAKYTLKQVDKQDTSPQSVLLDLRDYWHEARDLGMDLSKDSVKWPNNLRDAHIATTKRMKVKVDAELNAQIAERLPYLDHYSFSKDGLFIRPAASSIELFEEGKILHHCVGQYTERYAKGETNIFVVRRLVAPDIPFYTAEIRDGKVFQCRGHRNRGQTKEVAEFMHNFAAEMLQPKRKRRKIPA